MRCHLNFSQVFKIYGFDPQNLISDFTKQLQVNALTRILESDTHSVCHSDIVFIVDFITILASIPLAFLRYLSLAFRTAQKIHLSLIIKNDSCEIARKLEVNWLRLSMHNLVIFMKLIKHFFHETLSV